ncbi:MAG: YciI family protein [Phenylobacterium sp.]|nr:YciI family protein [Phenylobacterium sp.]
MPHFVLLCVDKPNSLDLRMATREAHLAFARGYGPKIKVGGPILSDSGEMAGSLVIMEADDLAEAQAFNANDPYTQAGLWERVEIRPFRATVGQL